MNLITYDGKSEMYDTDNSLSAIQIYCSLTEFSDYIKHKLTQDAKEHFLDCTFTPLKIWFNEQNMCIETIVVPVKQLK